MLNVLITSKSNIYNEAVSDAFSKYFKSEDINIEYLDSNDQNVLTISQFETLELALNNVKEGKDGNENFEYYIGIKSGIEYIEQDVFLYYWIVINHNNKTSKAKSISYSLPFELKENIKKGNSVEESEQLYEKENNIEHNEIIKFLSKNLITKKQILEETIILAISNLFY